MNYESNYKPFKSCEKPKDIKYISKLAKKKDTNNFWKVTLVSFVSAAILAFMGWTGTTIIGTSLELTKSTTNLTNQLIILRHEIQTLVSINSTRLDNLDVNTKDVQGRILKLEKEVSILEGKKDRPN